MPQWQNVGEKYKHWERGALWLWGEPQEGREYIIGVDCAEGVREGGDNSCFQIIDMQGLEQVAEFYSNNVSPNVYAQILQQIGVYYNTALVVIESNGVGSAVANALHMGLNYDNCNLQCCLSHLYHLKY